MELVHALVALAVVIVITVVPVMIAARWAHARRRGFLPALAAVVLATVAAHLSLTLIGDALIGLLIAFVAACAVYALVLRTSFVAAVGIAVVAMVLQVLIVTALVWLGLQLPLDIAVGER
ncbi:MAG: hypothetical protein U5K33_02490 [Halofilum sp. (in: g-proteobacteria)]|nr:hypothetical protein [Halofilum sp. (in: g-proteobacteria)]